MNFVGTVWSVVVFGTILGLAVASLFSEPIRQLAGMIGLGVVGVVIAIEAKRSQREINRRIEDEWRGRGDE